MNISKRDWRFICEGKSAAWCEFARACDIELDAEQDDLRVRGNAMCSGDDAVDKRVEDKILARLDRGDVWAWCSATVRVSHSEYPDAGPIEDYLGACSYKSEDDFIRCCGLIAESVGAKPRECGGYFHDMVRGCVTRLFDETAAVDSLVASAFAL